MITRSSRDEPARALGRPRSARRGAQRVSRRDAAVLRLEAGDLEHGAPLFADKPDPPARVFARGQAHVKPHAAIASPLRQDPHHAPAREVCEHHLRGNDGQFRAADDERTDGVPVLTSTRASTVWLAARRNLLRACRPPVAPTCVGFAPDAARLRARQRPACQYDGFSDVAHVAGTFGPQRSASAVSAQIACNFRARMRLRAGMRFKPREQNMRTFADGFDMTCSRATHTLACPEAIVRSSPQP
jgi:hypothetical protein